MAEKKRTEIRKVKELIKQLLTENEELRDDDNKLIISVYNIYLAEYGLDTRNLSFADVLNNSSKYNLPTLETIRRDRAKLQEKFEHLRASEKTERYRAEYEAVYREEFAPNGQL